MQNIKEKLDEELLIQNKTMAIINYFRLLGICRISKMFGAQVYEMTYGEKMYNKVIEDSKNGYIDLNKTNVDLFKELKSNLLLHKESSFIAPACVDELINTTWLDFPIGYIDDNDKAEFTLENSVGHLVYLDDSRYIPFRMQDLIDEVKDLANSLKLKYK